uniref:Vomeronasal type-1 receptor n=1 Tax=Canis lupus familiaris TaxID=9615 RepID=A0A8C0S1I9_CANLF
LWGNYNCGIILLSVIGLEIVGNFFILVRHVYTLLMGPEKKKKQTNPIGLILNHLAFANTIICTNESKDITVFFHLRNFLGNAGCKTVLYLGRVAGGLSICTTCHLSVVQAISISPRTTSWRKLKPQTTWQVLPYLLLFWIFNFLITSNFIWDYSYMLPPGQLIRWLFPTLMALQDVVFQSLMGWSSGYMALHLYRHHQSVLSLQSSRLQRKSSPGIRVTHSALILMTCFLLFYWAYFIVSFTTGSFLTNNYTILNIKTLITFGYASVSLYVLIKIGKTTNINHHHFYSAFF